MPYNISREVCLRHKDVLKQILERSVNGESFTIPTRKTNRAQQIREALEAVKHHDDFKIYAHLKDLYKVKQRKGHVELEFIGSAKPAPADSEQNGTSEAQPTVTPSPNVGIVPESIHLNEILDLYGVVSAAIRLERQADELFFPDANLPEEDKSRLYVWSQKSRWKYVDHEGAGLTLTKRNIDDFLLWEPTNATDTETSDDVGPNVLRSNSLLGVEPESSSGGTANQTDASGN